VANGASGTYYAAYENVGSGTLISFDKNGKALASNSFLGQPISAVFNKSLGLFIYTGSAISNLAVK
jgi:hypothetical protein